MKDRIFSVLGGVIGGLLILPLLSVAQDWYQASGAPVTRSALSSSVMRTEFASIESDISDKLPTLTGNGNALVAVNSGGSALTTVSHTSGTFDTDFTDACSTTDTVTWNYRLISDVVVLRADDSTTVNCASDSTAFSTAAGDVPAALRPMETVQISGFQGYNASFLTNACIRIQADGTFLLLRSVSAPCDSNWSASGTKGFLNSSSSAMVVYAIN